MTSNYSIYVHGVITKNPGGTGGWAYLILADIAAHIVDEATGKVFNQPTNTQHSVELIAVTRALEKCPAGRVIIYSDNRSIVEGIKWVADRLKQKGPDENFPICKYSNLWHAMRRRTEDVISEWLSKDSGNPFNELCHEKSRSVLRK